MLPYGPTTFRAGPLRVPRQHRPALGRSAGTESPKFAGTPLQTPKIGDRLGEKSECLAGNKKARQCLACMSGYALLVGFIPRKVAGDLSAALSTLATSLPRKATGW